MLLKILIASDLTMDTIETLILKSNLKKVEFCQNVENTLADHWNLPYDVPITKVSELIYNYIMDSNQMLLGKKNRSKKLKLHPLKMQHAQCKKKITCVSL